MNNSTLRMISRILIALMMLLPFQTAQAGMIRTDQVISANSAQSDRTMALNQRVRSEVASQLQSMGVDPQTARDRVAAMTDHEVSTIAGEIDSLPAGAWTNSQWGWLAAILIGAFIIYKWK
ncbi:MAG: PA2779 family protein [Gallionella sp.]|nr:PA2779 family protein [Gallionella sp.]